MADQHNSRVGRTDVPVVKVATVAVPQSRVPRDVLEQAISYLALSDEAVRDRLCAKLGALEEQYLVGRAIGRRYLGNHQAKAALGEVSELLGAVLEKLEQLGPEHLMILDANLQNKASDALAALPLLRSRLVLERVRDAASEAVAKYRPATGRPADPHLVFTIGVLMLLFERITGNRAKVLLTRDGAHCPRLDSPEAKAIGTFMMAVDPSLTETAIVNKIHEVCKVNKHGDLSHYRFGLLVGEPLTITPY